MAFDQATKAANGLRDRIGAGLSMVVESVKSAMAPESRETATFLAAAQSASHVMSRSDYGRSDLATQDWVQQLASAARTTSTNGPDQTNLIARGAIVVLDLTAFVTAASIQLTVERKNADATYTQIAAGPILAAVNRSVVLIDPLAGAESAGVGDSVSAVLPNEWRVRVVHGNANSSTYSVTAYPIR